MIHRSIVIALLIAVLLVGCAAPTPTPTPRPNDLLNRVQQRGTLIVAIDAAWPPQSELLADVEKAPDSKCGTGQYSANQVAGFDVDIAVELAKRIGVEACFVTPQWDLIVGGGWSDLWDMHLNSMTITRERTDVLYFGHPYSAGGTGFYVHTDNTSITDYADLEGKKIGVCSGCYTEFYLYGTLDLPGPTIEFKVKNPVVEAYQYEEDALLDLSQGDGTILDAALLGADAARAAMEAGTPIKPIGDPVMYTYTSPAFDKKSTFPTGGLISEINKAMISMFEDGTLSALSVKYYGIDTTVDAADFDLSTLESPPQ